MCVSTTCANPGRGSFCVGHELAFAEAGSHSWYPRRLDARARGEIEYEAPPGWTVVSTGVSVGSPDDESRGSFRFTASFASELWFAAARFSSYRLNGPIPVTVYSVSPGIRSDLLARRTSRTLDALRHIFGKFPYPGLSLIEVPPEVAEKAGGFNGVASEGSLSRHRSFNRSTSRISRTSWATSGGASRCRFAPAAWVVTTCSTKR